MAGFWDAVTAVPAAVSNAAQGLFGARPAVAQPTPSQTPESQKIFHGQKAVNELIKLYPDQMTRGMIDLASWEGYSPTPYRIPGEQFDTVGVGQTREYANMTYIEAYNKKEQQLRNAVNSIAKNKAFYDELPEGVRSALMVGHYRGDLTPKSGKLADSRTLAYIVNGNYPEASKEFLNSNNYRNTELDGVKRRMEWVSNIIGKGN